MIVDVFMALILIISFGIVLGFTHWCARVVGH